MADPGFQPKGVDFKWAPDALAKFDDKKKVGDVGPNGKWYSDDRNEIKNYLLSIPDMEKRRAESKRIHRVREQRRKEYQARLRQGDAAYDRASRKARIAAGIPAAKHAASRDAGNRAMRGYIRGYQRGARLKAQYGIRTPLEQTINRIPK